jgi:hypothetical protein
MVQCFVHTRVCPALYLPLACTAYDHLCAENIWLLSNTQGTGLNMVIGQGAEEIVRAAVSSWSDVGQLIDFREADAWQKMEQFGQGGRIPLSART